MRKASTIITLCTLMAALFPPFANAANVLEQYALGETIKVLVVPGHDNEYGGAVYAGREEADMTLPVAERIVELLNSNPRFSATLARTSEGYIPALSTYFENTEEIADFIDEHAEDMEKAIENGDVDIVDGVAHNNAPSLVVTRLYGINKWAPENDYDVVLHIHFNDHPGRTAATQNDVTGFSIYSPGPNLPNYRYGKVLGNALGERLKRSVSATNLPVEQAFINQSGVIEEEKLIAIGAKGTLFIPSVLVEYSYIYEPALQGDLFSLTKDVMAQASVYGITEYFSGIALSNKNLSYEWTKTLRKVSGVKADRDTLALQLALHELGLFPPLALGRDACQADGVFGPCTETALKEFQTRYGLDADGILGLQTRTKLNEFF